MNETMMLALTNKEWHSYDDHGNVILTDSAPAHVVKDYNEHVEFLKFYLGIDYYIYPDKFIKMRKRINYSDTLIDKELKQIYSRYELTRFRINFSQDILING